MSIPIFHMKLFRPGTQAWYNGRPYTVSHVSISGWNLKVSLNGLDEKIDADKVECDYTEINFNRPNT